MNAWGAGVCMSSQALTLSPCLFFFSCPVSGRLRGIVMRHCVFEVEELALAEG